MPRKTMSNFKKVSLVLASLQDNVIVTKFCEAHGIPRSTFYRWRKLVLAGLAMFIFGSKGASRGQKTIDAGKKRVKTYQCRLK